ncbi:MAG: hypothetical protein ABIF88_01905 [archaeon]
MKNSKLFGEMLIVISAFVLMATSNGLGFEIKSLGDYLAVVGLLVGLYLSFRGGLIKDYTDVA